MNSIFQWIEGHGVLISVFIAPFAGWGSWALWAWKIRPAFEIAHAISLALLQLPEIAKSVGLIKKEVSLNGGGSMRDAIKRIDIRTMRTEEQVRLSLMGMPTGHFDTNEKGEWIQVNPRLCQYLKKSEEQLLRNNWRFHLGRGRQEFLAAWLEAKELKSEFTQNVFFGDEEFVVRVQPMLDDAEIFMGFFGTLAPVGLNGEFPHELDRRSFKRDTSLLKLDGLPVGSREDLKN